VARLFTQKLYRANEKVFDKGELGNEAYIVMRGQVDIFLDDHAAPVASLGSGTIIGEQAFLDGAPRNASGIATQPSILLVIRRPAFNALVHTEPHLGMAVMRNIALEVSNKLRKANAALAQPTH
jgi:CRP/FNR family transcriptional regulator, cyclic AMP receptor protein